MDKIRHVPSLQGLQALVEVAGSGSFTQAAQKLCLTQSAVSRQIQQLEGHFGVALFVRSSRSLQLTAEGEQVLASARSILEQLRTLEDRLAPQKRPFRIRMHVSLAVRWLLPRLNEFYRHHPDVSWQSKPWPLKWSSRPVTATPTFSICPSRPQRPIA